MTGILYPYRMAWTRIPDFDFNTRNGSVCSICSNHKRPEDDGVFRSGVVVEYEGVFDICQSCASELSHLQGFTSPAESQRLQEEILTVVDELQAVQAEFQAKSDALSAVAGELASQAEHTAKSVAKAYEDGYAECFEARE